MLVLAECFVCLCLANSLFVCLVLRCWRLLFVGYLCVCRLCFTVVTGGYLVGEVVFIALFCGVCGTILGCSL